MEGGEEMDKLNMNLSVRSLDELKELLPQIATLQEKNDVVLKIQVNPGVITKINQF